MSLDLVSLRKCNVCQASTSPYWRRDQDDPTKHKCNTCYLAFRRQLALEGGLNKVCVTCKTTKTSLWYKDFFDKKKNRCSVCFERFRTTLSKGGAFGKSCNTCQSVKTNKWYKDPEDPIKHKCQRCYQIAKKEEKQPVALATSNLVTVGEKRCISQITSAGIPSLREVCKKIAAEDSGDDQCDFFSLELPR